jgi:glycosyltransferase involved in cell wall biosynthesis
MISYILPTRNRCALLLRAVDSCLSVGTLETPISVIVIDGGSSDGTETELRARYGGDKSVKIVQQREDSPGFMNACFEGVDLVGAPFATFMYDDDVLSPFIGQLYEPVVSGHSDFVIGFGAVMPAIEVRNFQPVGVMRRYDPQFVLDQYFGGRELPYTELPVSPICCLTTREHIIEWRSDVINFASARPLRRYLMLERNIGPDLIIYLSGLLRSNKDVTVCFTAIAQFSAHPDSMTVRYRNLDLSIGYWLARVFVIDKLVVQREFELAARCAGWLLATGTVLAMRAAVHGKGAFLGGVLSEVANMLRSMAAVGHLQRTLFHGARYALRRIRQGASPLTSPE